MPDVGEHYRPRDDFRDGDADAEAADGGDAPVYRVVGATDGIALLRVTDADGRRAHTGELRRVSPETFDAEFAPAEDPDAGLTPVATLRGILSGIYWDFRRFL